MATSPYVPPASRRNTRRTAARPAVSLALLCCGLAGACAAPPGDAPRRELRVGLAQREATLGVPAAVVTARLVGDATLVATARDGTPQPALAASWSTPPDGQSLRITLRPDLFFHDGSRLDADAVARFLASASGSVWYPALRAVTGVRATGPLDLTIDLREPSSLLLEALAMLAVTGGRDGTSGAGPFRITREDGGEVSLEAFEQYYLGRPALDRLELQTYPSLRAAWVALMRHEIELLYEVPPEAVEFVEASTDVEVFSFLRPYVYLFGFNVEHPALRRAALRRALNAAIDREHVIQQVFEGRATAATGPIWPAHWARSGVGPQVHDGPDASDVRVGGSPLRLSCLVPAGYDQFERLALVLQRELITAGIDLRPEVLPVAELEERLSNGRFDTYVLEQRAGPELQWAYTFWRSKVAFVRSGYDGADTALDRLRVARNADEVREAATAVERAFAQDPPAVFLAWGHRARALRRGYTVPREPGGDVFRTPALAQWRLAPGGRE